MPQHTPTPNELPPQDINADTHVLMYSVFRMQSRLPASESECGEGAAEVLRTLSNIEGLVIRGWYDVAGFRADADIMVWWHATSVDTLQRAYHALRSTRIGHLLQSVWSQVGIHRAAEFNRAHVPAFLAGAAPGSYLCVYPFVRSYEWYLLPAEERSTMLRDHGVAARDFSDVRANTVAAFGLGDYEWLLGFEAMDPVRLVDLMRELRATEARRHVREEVPFYTGRRLELATLLHRQAGR